MAELPKDVPPWIVPTNAARRPEVGQEPTFSPIGEGKGRVGVPEELPPTAPGGPRWSPRPPTELEREALDRTRRLRGE